MNDVFCTGLRVQRILSKVIFSIAVMFLLAGLNANGIGLLASAYAQEGASTKATMVIESISNSLANRGKNLVVTYYQDEQCSRRGKTDKVFKKNYVDDEHRFNPLMVETDSPFIFQVSYTEKRRGEIRRCAAISNVSLEPSRFYKAVFKIVDEVVSCNISVFDVTDITSAGSAASLDQNPELLLLQVPMMDKKPEFGCSKVGKQGYKNGVPVYSYKDRLG